MRISGEKEKTILLSIQNEFDQNQKKLDGIIIKHRDIANGCQSFINLSKPNPEVVTEDSLGKLLISILQIPNYWPETGAINSVISSGNISLIKNEELKYLLNSLPGKIDEYKYAETNIREGAMYHIKPLVVKLYPMRFSQVVNDLGEVIPGEAVDKSPFDYNQSSIFSNMELTNNVEMKRFDSEIAWDRAIKIKAYQDQILNLISGELENK